MKETIKIAIVEDKVDIAQGLRDILSLEEDFDCQQIYGDASEAISFLQNRPVDVVVLDIGLPDKSGIEVILSLKENFPEMQYCMFTVFDTDDKIFEALKAGAMGYILKNEDSENIIRAIRELHHGGSPMSTNIARRVINAFLNPNTHRHSEMQELTDREMMLLKLLSDGRLYKEIASELQLTLGTVKQYIHAIYKKLEVNNRTEAINKFLGRD